MAAAAVEKGDRGSRAFQWRGCCRETWPEGSWHQQQQKRRIEAPGHFRGEAVVEKHGFKERPTSKDDQGEEHDPLQEAEDVEWHIPAVGRSGELDRLVLGLSEVEGLEDDDSEHEVVDIEGSEVLLMES